MTVESNSSSSSESDQYDEDLENIAIETHNANEKKKEKLRRDIAELKNKISEVDAKIYPEVLENLDEEDDLSESQISPDNSVASIVKTSILEQDIMNLHKFSGMYCEHTENRTIVRMCVSDDDKKILTYMFEIILENGISRLVKYFLPSSVNGRLLEKNYLGEKNDIEGFLKDCRQLIDCFHWRKRQFFFLEEKTKSFKNIEVGHNFCYTSVYITFYGVKVAGKEKLYNFTCQILYPPAQVTPKSVKVREILLNTKTFNEKVKEQLEDFVHFFNEKKLAQAFRKICNTEHDTVQWEPFAPEIEEDFEDSTSEEDINGFLPEKKKNRSKKRSISNVVQDDEDYTPPKETRPKKKVKKTKPPKKLSKAKKKKTGKVDPRQTLLNFQSASISIRENQTLRDRQKKSDENVENVAEKEKTVELEKPVLPVKEKTVELEKRELPAKKKTVGSRQKSLEDIENVAEKEKTVELGKRKLPAKKKTVGSRQKSVKDIENVAEKEKTVELEKRDLPAKKKTVGSRKESVEDIENVAEKEKIVELEKRDFPAKKKTVGSRKESVEDIENVAEKEKTAELEKRELPAKKKPVEPRKPKIPVMKKTLPVTKKAVQPEKRKIPVLGKTVGPETEKTPTKRILLPLSEIKKVKSKIPKKIQQLTSFVASTPNPHHLRKKQVIVDPELSGIEKTAH